MNVTFLSRLINAVTRHLIMSRDGRFIMDRNTKGYEVAEHMATKVDVNPRMLSTLENEKSI